MFFSRAWPLLVCFRELCFRGRGYRVGEKRYLYEKLFIVLGAHAAAATFESFSTLVYIYT